MRKALLRVLEVGDEDFLQAFGMGLLREGWVRAEKNDGEIAFAMVVYQF